MGKCYISSQEGSEQYWNVTVFYMCKCIFSLNIQSIYEATFKRRHERSNNKIRFGP